MIITSVLIPSFNRDNLLEITLRSILEYNKIDSSYEILLLNEGILSEKIQELADRYSKPLNLKLIDTAINKKDRNDWRIPGFAFNIGAKQAKGEILILHDAEMYNYNNCLNLISEPLKYSKNLITVPLIKDDDGRFLKTQDRNIVYDLISLPNYKLPFLIGVSKESFIEIGGYDEDMLGLCFDDNDLVYRLELNRNSYFQTDAITVHLYHEHLFLRNMTDEQKIRRNYNMKLYEERRGTIKRNINREWGIL